MPLFDPTPQAATTNRRTPNWRQTLWLLLGGLLVAGGSCAGALGVFSVAYGRSTRTMIVLWWLLMAVFAVAVLAFIAGLVFLLILALRALLNAGRGGTS
jgi:hypothetical protein